MVQLYSRDMSVACPFSVKRYWTSLIGPSTVIVLLFCMSSTIWNESYAVREDIVLGNRDTGAECPESHGYPWRLNIKRMGELCSSLGVLYNFDDVTKYSSRIRSCFHRDGSNGPIVPYFRVLGERHSGTNAIAQLFYHNFDLDKDHITNENFPMALNFPGDPIDFGISEHKHDEQRPGETQYQPGLTVVSVRNPYDWVKSFQKKCYGCEQRNTKNYLGTVEAFVSQAWVGGDHVYQDVATYKNIFDMRYKKVCNHIRSALTQSDCLIYLRQEDNLLPTSKNAIVEMAAAMTGWTPSGSQMSFDQLQYYGHNEDKTDYRSIESYIHSSLYFRQSNNNALTEEDKELIQAVNAHADPAFEHALGYILMFNMTPTTVR